MHEVTRLLTELDGIDPDRGRAAVRRRVAWRLHRILELSASAEVDDQIKAAVIDALQERLESWEPETRREIMHHFREIGPR